MSKVILKIDGIFLLVMGTLAAITDLISYFLGIGPFGNVYFNKSIAIGGFEAHCLAIISGIILLSKSKKDDTIFFNKIAIAIHSALGISNLIFFRVFFETETIPMGYLTTIVHFILIVLNIIVVFKPIKLPAKATTN